MSASCTNCAKFMHCQKDTGLTGCGNHKPKVIVPKQLTRKNLEEKLNTLELAREERSAIWKRNELYTIGKDFEKLNDNLAEAYTKTIAKINTELFEKYGILATNYGEKVRKEEILANFDEGCCL